MTEVDFVDMSRGAVLGGKMCDSAGDVLTCCQSHLEVRDASVIMARFSVHFALRAWLDSF